MAQSKYSTDDTLHGLRDKASDQMSNVAEQVENAASNIAQRGREVGENVQQVAGNLKGAVDSSVREQPMATLAVAATLGFVLGALWKS